MLPVSLVHFCFFFNDTATTEIYTLSLHDALPIWQCRGGRPAAACRAGSARRRGRAAAFRRARAAGPQALKLGPDAIARLVPHQGAMCLLEEVLEWSDDAIVCRACSHRDSTNPLRSRGGLPGIAGVEYAAQALAVHGGLIKKGDRPVVGFLAGLRDILCSVERLDTEPGDLTIHATKVAAEGGRLLYDFRIAAGDRDLVKGRVSIVLRSG